MGNDSAKPFGFIILFILTLFSYTPMKAELVDIANNVTLSNNAVIMLNSVFGLIWTLLAVVWLGLAVITATDI